MTDPIQSAIAAAYADAARMQALREIWPLVNAARELAAFASYAEIVGGVSVNRAQIREWCDAVVKSLPRDQFGFVADDPAAVAANPALIGVEPWTPPPAWGDVMAERRRQIEAEGWSVEHDDLYVDSELTAAAACYALAESGWERKVLTPLSMLWPWSPMWWKPSSRRRNLVKAAALILAEIERLDRKPLPTAKETDE